MSDSRDTRTQQAPAQDQPQPPGMPRWVKITWIVAAAFAVALVVKLVVDGGSGHGPSRHGALSGATLPTAISSAPPAADL